jgi:hypothetical protein
MKAETQPTIFFSLAGCYIGLFVGSTNFEDREPPDCIDLQPVLGGRIEYKPHNEGLRVAAFEEGIFAYNEKGNLCVTAFEESHLIYVVEKLLHDGILERGRLADHEYVWSKVRTNSVSILEEMGVIAEPYADLVNFARTAIENGKREAAILLIATAIEQRLNVFYRYALIARNLLTNLLTEDEICDIIRSNLPPKTSWLLALISGHRLSDEIRTQITTVSEIRNQIVHFKAAPSERLKDDLKGSHNLLRQRLEKIDYEGLLQLPERLSQELDEILELIHTTNLPDYSLARNAVKMLTEGIKSGEVIRGMFIVTPA